ncbi:MAG: aminotransferase class I/II-fold pyridoxal phosphate-dependent enzyme [Thermoplasmata archaeon]|nr:aminotransferase class I/II-fold pyridoxal phosphate-dependent enzyme [Thermoplasmata archaeon]
MARPTFDLLHYIVDRLPKTRHDLASSHLPAVPVEVDSIRNMEPTEPDLAGSPELRDVIGRASGVPSDRVMVTAGASEANFLVGLALVQRGDRVAVERPAYEPLWKAFQLLGAEIEFLPRPFRLGFRPDWDAVDRLASAPPRLLVLTNLHNPSGTALGAKALARLAEVAEAGGFHVLMDEIFREAAVDKPPPSAATVSDRFIVTSSITKVYGLGGLRLGWCVASPEVLEPLQQAKDFTSVASSTPTDALGVRLLADPHAVRRRNRTLLQRNRKLVEEWIEGETALEWVRPEGNVSFPRFEGDVDRLAEVALERYQVLIAPGRLFGAPAHFRLCFGVPASEVVAGLEGLTSALRDLRT